MMTALQSRSFLSNSITPSLDSVTRHRHSWNGAIKNEYVSLIHVYGTVGKMLKALRSAGHRLLPSRPSLYKWKRHYEDNGPFSPLEQKELRARAVKMFEEALGRMGLDFDSEAHMCI